MKSDAGSSHPFSLQIRGMSCQHCVAAVQKALRQTAGVAIEAVGVGYAQIRAQDASLALLAVEAITDAGFEATMHPRGS